MALAVRASASAKVSAPRKVQAKATRAARPAQLNLASVASLASVAAAAVAVAPAEAHNVVMSLAEEPYAAAWISPILVPVTGLFFPALAMSSLFLYIQKEKPSA